ncbi:MAG TPA: hypothetical protein VKD72_00010 [Gemmataceae bacterium]|nr:hypothetical protein [Gemmataceae bacterium]
MLHIPPILLPCLLCLAPVPRPAPSLLEVVFEALRTANTRPLEALCVLRQDYPGPWILSGNAALTKEERAREATEWERQVALEVEESVPRVRFYGNAIGFDWSKARLHEVRARATENEGVPYDPKEHDSIHGKLALVLRSGDKELTVFVPKRGTPRGPRLAGAWVATDLTHQERKAFRAWTHESTDQDIARLISRKHLTKEFFIFNDFHGRHQDLYGGFTVRLPPTFDKKRRDTIVCIRETPPSAPLAKGNLIETGVDTLCFQGDLHTGVVSDLPRRVRLTLDPRDGPDFIKRERWRARDRAGRTLEFVRVPGAPRTFHCREIEVRRYFGALESPEVDVTFVDGMATELRPVKKVQKPHDKK